MFLKDMAQEQLNLALNEKKTLSLLSSLHSFPILYISDWIRVLVD